MALKAQLEKLDGLPEAVAKEYTRVDLADGKHIFRLSVDDVDGFTLMNPSLLQSTIQELSTHKSRADQYGAITPESAKAAQKTIETLTRERDDAKKATGLKDEERFKQVQAELERTIGAERDEAKALANVRFEEIVEQRRTRAALTAALAAGFTGTDAELIAPLIAAQLDVLEDPKESDKAKRYRTIVRDEKGAPKVALEKTKDGTKHRDMTELDLAKDFATGKFKDYVTVETKKPEEKAKGKLHVLSSQTIDGLGSTEDPIEMLVTARGG